MYWPGLLFTVWKVYSWLSLPSHRRRAAGWRESPRGTWTCPTCRSRDTCRTPAHQQSPETEQWCWHLPGSRSSRQDGDPRLYVDTQSWTLSCLSSCGGPTSDLVGNIVSQSPLLSILLLIALSPTILLSRSTGWSRDSQWDSAQTVSALNHQTNEISSSEFFRHLGDLTLPRQMWH